MIDSWQNAFSCVPDAEKVNPRFWSGTFLTLAVVKRTRLNDVRNILFQHKYYENQASLH